MFQSITDVKNYITKTILKYSKEFVVPDYKIEYSNRFRRCLGRCGMRYFCGTPIQITFTFNNKYLASFKDNEEAIKDTVLHEIAHAMAGGHHHHDRVWVSCCNRIGANPSRCKKVEF